MKISGKRALLFVGCVLAAGALLSGVSCKKKNAAGSGEITIGIAKIVAHPALDNAERGIIDVINEAGFKVKYDLQNANGDVNTATQIAAKFREEKPAVIVGIATPVAVALANNIKDIPIVFGTVTDPVGAGLVTTLEHGEGNVTGMSDAIPTGRHIRMFKELAGIKTLGYIYTGSEANSITALTQVDEAAEENGIELVTQAISISTEVKQAAEAIVGRVDGLYISTDNTVFASFPAIRQVFNSAKKPIFGGDATQAGDGGFLIAMGFNYYKAGRATGELVVEILNGKSPEEIPVRFLTDAKDSDFVIDLDIAKQCGIIIPQNYIDDANMIIENGVVTGK